MDLNILLNKAERKLVGLHPYVADKARELIKSAYENGIEIIITQGLRTIAEQNALYAQGRTDKTKPIVTNARGGQSMHNYALAFDIAILKSNGDIDWNNEAKYRKVGQLGKKKNLEWGGDFKNLVDMPHFQFTFGLTLNDLQKGKRPPTAPVKAKVAMVTKKFVAVVTGKKYVTVVSGDSLSKIALKNNTTVEAIKKLNKLKSDVIQINQKLRVK